jgi:hypothetical protein
MNLLGKQLRGFELYGMLVAKDAELCSMKAANQGRLRRAESPAFGEDEFIAIAEEVDRITHEIRNLTLGG